MSHTDKDAPLWVHALWATWEGQPVEVHHSAYCEEYDGVRHVSYDRLRKVPPAIAEANGWPLAEGWWAEHNTEDRVYVRVPFGPFACDLDHHNSRCASWPRFEVPYRFYTNVHREHFREGYFVPERRHVRDTLRNAVKDYNANGDTDIEPINRQTRRSMWNGGWWD
jgi:hypothetical protein